jgi:hypothetical protein
LSSLKHCRESAEIISVLKCLANSIASEVLPTAVGPAITMIVFNFNSDYGAGTKLLSESNFL